MNLALIFCSITPAQYSDKINELRIIEYNRSLKQLRRLCPFDIQIFDNTEYSKGHNFIKHVSENIGIINKGLGELSMLKYACDNNYLEGYDKICYITGRHLFICPYFFEKVKEMKSNILVSNPDFIYINGDYHKVEKNLYNDMAFAMSKDVIKVYAEYINFDDEKTGSEQWLYKFVNSIREPHEMINHLGLIRNDWQKTKDYININNYHGV